MTDEQRAELKRLAENATGGRWTAKAYYNENGGRYDAVACDVGEVVGDCSTSEDDARFIAAANPGAVLDLLAEHEDAKGIIRVWRGLAERAESERVANKADNAALLAVLRRAAKAWAKVTTCRLGIAAARDDIDPITRVREEAHPGAALLEDLRATRQTAQAYLDAATTRNADGDDVIMGPGLVKATLERAKAVEAENESLKAEIQRLKDEATEASLLAMEREEAKDVL